MRLIDADKLKIDYFAPSSTTNTVNYYYVSMAQIVQGPTIDAVPVRHGEWISEKYPLVSCSICGKTQILADYDNYCPNCGAKTDGKEQNDEH